MVHIINQLARLSSMKYFNIYFSIVVDTYLQQDYSHAFRLQWNCDDGLCNYCNEMSDARSMIDPFHLQQLLLEEGEVAVEHV